MTHEPPQIFDRQLWRLRRGRAAAGFGAYDFLVRIAAQELRDRLRVQTPAPGPALIHGAAEADALGLNGVDAVSSDPCAGFLALGRMRAVYDETALPLAAGTLGLYVSVLTLHTVNDLPGTLIQIRRALKPGGLFLGVMLGGETLREWRAALAAAELEIEGGVSPRVAPLIDVKDAGALLQRAGFVQPVADIERQQVTYGDPSRLLRDLKGMGESNVLHARRRGPINRRTLACALALLAKAPETATVTFDLLCLTGFAPGP